VRPPYVVRSISNVGGRRYVANVMRLALLLLLVGGVSAPGAAAQAHASLGVGAGTVRYRGGTGFSSASVSPALQYATPTLVTGVSGSLASLPDAEWSSQGRGDLWVASPPIANSWRLGVETTLVGMSSTDGGRTAAAHGLGELLWSRPLWGFGLGVGPSAGWIADRASITALHTRARAWWRGNAGAWRTSWSLSVEPTRFLGAWFTDGTVGVDLERGPVVAGLSTTARVSAVYGSKGAGSAFLQFFVSRHVAMEFGGGSYLPDPYQGLPLAGVVTLGVRLHSSARDRSVRHWSPLVPESRGDSVVVRLRFDGARSVAIAGDWNEWQAVPLRALGEELWEAALAVPRGIHHFNILVNGTEWVVPRGVATVSDGLGGMVGVLLVP
jgi:AMP-activated protein kinase-like protein